MGHFSKDHPAIGIDLGTTHSLICVFENGDARLIKNTHGEVLTPSVVSCADGQISVGATALAKAITHPTQTVSFFKRSMGSDRSFTLGKKSYRAEELSALVLRSLKKDAEIDLGCPIAQAVVSVPAYFNDPRRNAVRNACELAGFETIRLINEPTAAALAYGVHERDNESTFLIYDLGGGTFDVSIMELFEGVMEVRSSAGDAFIGGQDFTLALVEHAKTQLKLESLSPAQEQTLFSLAEQCKRELSSKETAAIRWQAGHEALRLEVSRSTFSDINRANLERLSRPVKIAISDAQVPVQDISRVILVGGATRMPMIRSLIATQFRSFPEARKNPDHVVALGAAVQAGLLAQKKELKELVMTDVCPFTLGVETSRSFENTSIHGVFAPIIERNTVIPVSRESAFQTIELGQTAVCFEVYQGEAPLAKDNVRLGKVDVRVPKNKKEHETIIVRFTYDASGLLEVEATVPSTGKVSKVVIEKLASELSPDDIKRKLKELEVLKVHPRDSEQVRLFIARVERCYAVARGETRGVLSEILVQFKAEVEQSQDNRRVTVLRNELSPTIENIEKELGLLPIVLN